MIIDYILDYWIEAVETSLEDIGKLTDFSKTEIRSMAEDMYTSADCQDMAFGSNMAENPLIAEIKELRHKCDNAKNESDDRERILFDHITKGHRYLSVSIKDGRVWFD